jgi:hypothetical protein
MPQVNDVAQEQQSLMNVLISECAKSSFLVAVIMD